MIPSQSREELWRKDALGQVTIITFMQLALVCVCFFANAAL